MNFSRLILVLLLSFSSLANAAFVASNDPVGGNGYVDDYGFFFTLYSSDNSSSVSGLVSFTYTDTAVSEALVSFDWKYITLDIAGSSLDPAGFILNGTKTQLSVNDMPQFSASPAVGLGSFSMNINAGDVFGFYVDATDNTLGRGVFTIKNLVITAVPEPETYAMFVAGIGLLGFASRRKIS